jgi:hypothetical protein
MCKILAACYNHIRVGLTLLDKTVTNIQPRAIDPALASRDSGRQAAPKSQQIPGHSLMYSQTADHSAGNFRYLRHFNH